MSRAEPIVNFHIPAELKAEVEAAARAAGRSRTAEIVHRLAAYQKPPSIEFEVDTAPIEAATRACEELTKAAEAAFAACEKLGIAKAGEPS